MKLRVVCRPCGWSSRVETPGVSCLRPSVPLVWCVWKRDAEGDESGLSWTGERKSKEERERGIKANEKIYPLFLIGPAYLVKKIVI